MTKRHPIVFLLVIFCVTLLSLTSAMPSDDLGSRVRQERQEDQRRTGRASLHELLMKNRNVASSASESPSAENNENRRILILGDGEDTPNYVYDDEIINDNDNDDQQRNLNADFYETDSSHDMTFGNVGDQVTNYATPFASIDAPSYADPNLLAAVMDQADKANFRFPGDKRKVIITEDQTVSDSAKIETANSGKHEINPFELFPEEFHTLLEIPIHTYANGTTYNPHSRHKVRPSSPTITDGYANTNVNGKASSKENTPQNEKDSKPKRILTRLRRPLLNRRVNTRRNNPPRRKATTTTTTKTTATTTTTEQPTRKPSPPQRKRLDYVNFSRNPERNKNLNRLPPLGKNPPRRIRPVRPSLRFRTRSPPITKQVYTTTSTPEITTTTETPIPITTPLNNRHTYKPVKRLIRPVSPPSTETSEVNRPAKPLHHIVHDSISDHTEDVQGNVRRRKPSFSVSHSEEKELLAPTRESNYGERNHNNQDNPDNHREPSLAINEDTHKRNKNITTDPPKTTQTESTNENVQLDETYFLDVPKLYTKIPKDIYKKPSKDAIPQAKKNSKLEFKPSKIDPFVDRLPSHPPFVDSKYNKEEKKIPPTTFRPHHKIEYTKRQIITPTTFRPHHKIEYTKRQIITPTTFRPPHIPGSAYSNVLPPVVNTYQRPLQEDRNYYYYDNTYGDNGTPFTNSHTIRKPFVQTNIYNQPPERQNTYLERERGVPVYVSSPFAHVIQKQFDKYDEHSPINIGLQPPTSVIHRGFPAGNKFSYDNLPGRRRNRRPVNSNGRPFVKRRPSFLEKLGFFKSRKVNRRTGESGPKAQVNDIRNTYDKQNTKTDVDYVLTNGPVPFNGKKLVVFGPFKVPPIGAPRIYPTNQAHTFSAPPEPAEPAFDLRPPSSFVQPVIRSETSTRGPSFKVVNLPKERNDVIYHDIADTDDSDHVVVRSQFEVDNSYQEESPRSYTQGTVIPIPTNVINGSPVSYSNRAPIPNLYSGFNSPVKVEHNNYHLFEEVSDEDKERLIAAKFEFPRKSSVRRSGLERHVIPIPVPMMTSSGEQISKFQSFHVPHVPIIRKMGRTPMNKYNRNVEKVFFPSQNKIPNAVKRQNSIQAVTPIPSVIYSQTPMRITTYPQPTSSKESEFEQPLRYQEPSFTDIKFGGWHAVGKAPVVGYVKENTPVLEFKTEIDEGTKVQIKKKSGAKTMKQSGKEESDTESHSTYTSEKDLVRFSSKLNVEAPEVVRSYLVDPPRKL